MPSVLTQCLIEYMEKVAIASGGRWDHHNYCYIEFQMSIKCAVEGADSFGAIPAAFTSTKNFLDWIERNGLSKEQVGTLSDPAYITHAETCTSFELANSSFIWVKAASSRYRNVLLHWLNFVRKDRRLAGVQESAAIVYHQVADSLKEGDIRKKISPVHRAKLVNIFRTMATRCHNASSSEAAAVKDLHLLKPFDSTLDADHVINKQSLKDIPDAWVMLAPVIASSNRGFGLAVEKYAVPFTAQRGSIGLDAVTAFKLLASTFPKTATTLDDQVTAFREGFCPQGPGLKAELEAVAEKLRGFMDGANKSFTR